MFKPKRTSKYRLVRPADALLPGAFLLAGALGREAVAAQLCFFLIITRLAGLAAPIAARAAFAAQPSIRAVRGTVRTALLMQTAGGALTALILLAVFRGAMPADVPWQLAGGLLLNIEHVFYEYLFAAGETGSARLCRGVTALLTFAGLMLTAPMSGGSALAHVPGWTLAAAALSAGLAGGIGLSIGGGLKGRLNRQLLRESPRALLQTALYPLAGWGILRLCGVERAYPFFCGWIVYELCRAPFRRAPSESRAMNRALAAVAAAGALLALICHLSGVRAGLGVALSLVTGSACALGMFGSIDRRRDD